MENVTSQNSQDETVNNLKEKRRNLEAKKITVCQRLPVVTRKVQNAPFHLLHA